MISGKSQTLISCILALFALSCFSPMFFTLLTKALMLLLVALTLDQGLQRQKHTGPK